MRQALKSPLFRKLNETGMLIGDHTGGCLLFEKEGQVAEYIQNAVDKGKLDFNVNM